MSFKPSGAAENDAESVYAFQTMNYTNKYNLPDDSRTREILIRRHVSVRRSLRAESFREPVSFLFQVSITYPPAWPSPDLHLTFSVLLFQPSRNIPKSQKYFSLQPGGDLETAFALRRRSHGEDLLEGTGSEDQTQTDRWWNVGVRWKRRRGAPLRPDAALLIPLPHPHEEAEHHRGGRTEQPGGVRTPRREGAGSSPQEASLGSGGLRRGRPWTGAATTATSTWRLGPREPGPPSQWDAAQGLVTGAQMKTTSTNDPEMNLSSTSVTSLLPQQPYGNFYLFLYHACVIFLVLANKWDSAELLVYFFILKYTFFLT